MPNNYGHAALQSGQMRTALVITPDAMAVLEAYAALGSAPWAPALLDDLVRTVVCAAMPRWQDCVAPNGMAPPSVAEAIYDKECWMREGARQLVLQILKTMHEAPGLLAQIQEEKAR